MFRSKCLSVVVLLTFVSTLSWSVNGQTLRKRLITVAGELKIAQLDEGELGNKYAVTLNENTILKTDGDKEEGSFSGFPIPTILQHFRSGVHPYDEVVLFQQNMWGNACNGGPLWFLGLNKNGSFFISKPIDFCGGHAPIIKSSGDAITVIIPGGPPNHGEGYISGESWIYQNGKVRQIRNRKRSR